MHLIVFDKNKCIISTVVTERTKQWISVNLDFKDAWHTYYDVFPHLWRFLSWLYPLFLTCRPSSYLQNIPHLFVYLIIVHMAWSYIVNEYVYFQSASDPEEGNVASLEAVIDLSDSSSSPSDGEMVAALFQPNDQSKLAMAVGDKVSNSNFSPFRVFEHIYVYWNCI